MVSTDGIARITDFGVAKAEVRLMSTTRQGQFKGKLAYMAPEHASTGEADQRSDLFSAGIILWESLTGRRLFRAENQAATLNKICIEPIPMPSSIDPNLAPFDPVLERALARDPNERFQTAEEFAEALEAHADLLGGLANQRAVGKLVREYAAEKIERDRELIRTAVAELGAAPNAEGAHESHPAPAFAAPDAMLPPEGHFAAPAQVQVPPPVASREDELEEQKPRYGLWVLGGLAAVAVAVAVWAVSMRGAYNGNVHSTPLEPAPPAASVDSHEASEPVTPTGATEGPAAGTAANAAVDNAPAEAGSGAAAKAPNEPGASKPEASEHATEPPPVAPPPRAQRHRPQPTVPNNIEKTAPPPKKVPPPPAAAPDLMLNPYRTK
jgi:serine/threonine-protein kinase